VIGICVKELAKPSRFSWWIAWHDDVVFGVMLMCISIDYMNVIVVVIHTWWISVATHLFQLAHIQFSSWQFFSSFSGPKLLGSF
jgi:hypothetical protein